MGGATHRDAWDKQGGAILQGANGPTIHTNPLSKGEPIGGGGGAIKTHCTAMNSVAANWRLNNNQKTREGCGCPKFLAGKVLRKILTLLENSSPIVRQHEMLSLPRFGHFPARKTAAGKFAAPSGTLLDFLLRDSAILVSSNVRSLHTLRVFLRFCRPGIGIAPRQPSDCMFFSSYCNRLARQKSMLTTMVTAILRCEICAGKFWELPPWSMLDFSWNVTSFSFLMSCEDMSDMSMRRETCRVDVYHRALQRANPKGVTSLFQVLQTLFDENMTKNVRFSLSPKGPCRSIQRRKKRTRPPPKENLLGNSSGLKENFPGRWWIQKPYEN